MQEKIRAYLRDWDSPASIDNIDFETAVYLKKAEKQGHSFEFGKYDLRDGSVEVTLDLLDSLKKALPESQAEWEEKRKWYLEHAGNSPKLLREGICEGYLIETPNVLDEVCGDLVNAMRTMQMEESPPNYEWLEREYEAEQEYDYGEDWMESEFTAREKNSFPRQFLRKGKKINYTMVERARNFREKLLRGKPWKNEEFEEIGFRIPKNIGPAEQDAYIVATLDSFVEFAHDMKQTPRGALRGLVRSLGLDRSLVNEAKINPWEVYEALKESYCASVRNPREYDSRIEHLVFALGI